VRTFVRMARAMEDLTLVLAEGVRLRRVLVRCACGIGGGGRGREAGWGVYLLFLEHIGGAERCISGLEIMGIECGSLVLRTCTIQANAGWHQCFYSLGAARTLGVVNEWGRSRSRQHYSSKLTIQDRVPTCIFHCVWFLSTTSTHAVQ